MLLRDAAGIVDVIDGQQLHGAVVVQPVVQRLGAEAERRLQLVSAQALVRSGDDAALDEVDDAVGEQLRVDAEVAVAAQALQDRIRDPADPDLHRGAVRDLGDDRGCDRPVAFVGGGGRDLDERPVHLAPPEDLRDVDLVVTERARHLGVDLEEERDAADERCHVVGVRPEARSGRGASGGLAAASTSGCWVTLRSSSGISEKWFGTRSQPPAQNASRVAADRK